MSQPMASAKPGWGGDALLSFVDSRVDGGGEMVAVAGPPDHRRETDVVELPTEERCIERGSRGRIAGVQIAEVPASGRVGELGSQPPSRLPQAEAAPRGSTQAANRPPDPASADAASMNV
jgi:hypothetical protein